MAEAHSAVAFSFSITHEGVDINYDHETIYAIWQSGMRSWRRRVTKFWNSIANGAFPASPYMLIFITIVSNYICFSNNAVIHGLANFLRFVLDGHSIMITVLLGSVYCSCALLILFVAMHSIRYFVKLLLMYKGWMYEARGGKNISKVTRIWLCLIKVLVQRKPKLFSFQGSLPNLPLPSLNETMDRYLLSIIALHDSENYQRLEKLTYEFKTGIGIKLQWYLWLKSWWATNYVSDWWEEFIYLRGRGPLMINSNFYGTDAILITSTTNQAARAASLIHFALMFRRTIDRQTMSPIMVQNIVPLCSAQYERVFNTTRIPGIKGDKLVHLDDSQHIALYYGGRYFKVPLYYLGRLLKPAEIQKQIEGIMSIDSVGVEGEKQVGALTAVERELWAETRLKYFNKGLNKASLDAIEKAAFFVVLDDEDYEYNPDDPSKLNHFGRAMLHGKGYNRWFDKSFTLIIGKNGRAGLNAEHSWADAPIMSHLWEFCLAHDINQYTEDGNCKGECEIHPPDPIHLKWDLAPECIEIIKNCVGSAEEAISDVDLRLVMHDAYGKGFMKTCKVSPDAYIQMALQLAYFRDAGKFSLTYEASMTRLYREGRTETVRPVTIESCLFVKAMSESKFSEEERKDLFRKACDRHQRGYQDAMCGKGIDRHLFCLYVVARYLNEESPFLDEVLAEPWRLSTSQTPHGQTDLMDFKKNPQYISAGGGFGPVADDGYGVSYIIAGEDIIFFHISSKVSSPETDSERFSQHLQEALKDIKDLFNKQGDKTTI